MEICVKCGEETYELHEVTGWCIPCSTDYCIRCGELKADKNKILCNTCTRIKWLEDHADEIEEKQREGLSLTAAREAIYDNNRPTCLVCNRKMNGAKTSALICNKTSTCRSAKRRFRTLQEGAQKLPKQIAMEQVLRELGKL